MDEGLSGPKALAVVLHMDFEERLASYTRKGCQLLNFVVSIGKGSTPFQMSDPLVIVLMRTAFRFGDV